jgi:hypothetical protein
VTGRTSTVKHPLEIPLNGIDGLTRTGSELVAIQNGTNPARLMRLHLDHSGSTIVSAKVVQSNSTLLGTPTHGVIYGHRFYYLANTGTENFNEKGNVAPSKHLSPSRIMSFELR